MTHARSVVVEAPEAFRLDRHDVDPGLCVKDKRVGTALVVRVPEDFRVERDPSSTVPDGNSLH